MIKKTFKRKRLLNKLNSIDHDSEIESISSIKFNIVGQNTFLILDFQICSKILNSI